MRLIETLTFDDLTFYRELGEREGLAGERLVNFLEKMGISRDVYEIRYFKDDQDNRDKKHFFNGSEVEHNFFSEFVLLQFRELEANSQRLRANYF